MKGDERNVITTFEAPMCTSSATTQAAPATDALLLPLLLPFIFIKRLFESIGSLSSGIAQSQGTTLVNITYDGSGRIASILEKRL